MKSRRLSALFVPGAFAVLTVVGAGSGVLASNDAPVFAPHQVFGVGDFPLDIVAADLDGDGVMDLATADHRFAAVSVLYGNGDGTFQPGMLVPAGGDPTAMVVADFDGDGLLDLAQANEQGNVSVQRSIDGVNFSISVITVGGIGDGILAGDVSGDGELDLVVRTGGLVWILEGRGDATFEAPVSLAIGGVAQARMGGADFNGDGLLDLAILTGPGGLEEYRIHLANGDLTFTQMPSVNVGGSPEFGAFGDFDGDGAVDLVSILNPGSAASSGVAIAPGNGDGTFQLSSSMVTGRIHESAAVFDVNGDGDLDIVLANRVSNSVTVLLGNGDLTFEIQPDVQTGSSPRATAFGDFDGDGDVDFAVNNAIGDSVSVFLQIDAPGDCDTSGVVDFGDLISILFEFGGSSDPGNCDVDGSGSVDFVDLVAALFRFGPCP